MKKKSRSENRKPVDRANLQRICIALNLDDFPFPEDKDRIIEDRRLFDKIIAISYWKNLPISDVIHGLLKYSVMAYEDEKGPIEYIPEVL